VHKEVINFVSIILNKRYALSGLTEAAYRTHLNFLQEESVIPILN